MLGEEPRDLYDQVEQAIRQLHPYEVPRFWPLPILAGSADYLAWLDGEVSPETTLNDFLHNLDKMRCFCRLGKLRGFLVGLLTLAVLEQGDSPQGLVEHAQRPSDETSLATLARLFA